VIKNGDMERKPYQKDVFPDLEKVDFRLPEKKGLFEMPGETQRLLDWIDPIDNDHYHYPEVDDVAKENIDVDFFNIDRLNTINKKRLHGLANVEGRPTQPTLNDLDKRLFNYLDKESTEKIYKPSAFSDPTNQNELQHRDILKEYEGINPDQFKDPINQFDKIDL